MIYPAAEALAERGIPFLLLSGYGREAVPLNHPEWEACSKPFKALDLTARLGARFQAGRHGILLGRKVGWCRVRDLNPRPSVYKTAALPLC